MKAPRQSIFRIAGIFMGMTVPLAAQEIPEDLLRVDFQRCMQSCTPGYGEETCTPLCTCTVAEFKKRLNFDQYLSLRSELASTQVGAQNRQLLDTIAKYCADKALPDNAGAAPGTSDR